MYTVVVTKPAQKQLKKIDKRYQIIIERRIRELSTNPFLGKKLNDNLKKYRSLREGVYRIIYKVVDRELVITVISISHRQGAYKLK